MVETPPARYRRLAWLRLAWPRLGWSRRRWLRRTVTALAAVVTCLAVLLAAGWVALLVEDGGTPSAAA
ncbi:MAG TPA: hypothetical protein VGJ07_19875, partial [Rugosimonospora sp.]